MNKFIHSIFIAAIASLTAVCVQAAETPSEVLVLDVTGSAKAVVPGSTTTIDVKAGSKLPQGTILKTADGSQVKLEVFPGIITTVEPDSEVDLSKVSLTANDGKVTERTAVISLKSGSVGSNIDPSNKAINRYAVSTPKGVAAARGTAFNVSIRTNGDIVLSVTRGSVLFTPANGGTSILVEQDYFIVVHEDGKIDAPEKSGPNQANPDTGTQKPNTTPPTANQVIDTTIVSPSNP